MELRSSKYNHFLPLPDGKSAAYNCRNGSFLVLTEQTADRVRDILRSDFQTDDGLTMVLLEFGFLISAEYDELLEIQKELFHQRFPRTSGGVTIAPTLDCNLRCKYCYEMNARRKGTMSEEVEGAFYEYLDRELARMTHFSLTWYGGEPFLCPTHVLRMTKKAKELCDKNEVRLGVSMVSNGTLFTQDIISELSTLGKPGSIQVTLDGPPDVNDARKPFASGRGSMFEAVVSNLSNIDFKGFSVSIRCNVDRHNSETAKGLLDELRRRKRTRLPVYPAIVTPPHGACQSAVDCFNPAEFTDVIREFATQSRQLGFPLAITPHARRSYCMADSLPGLLLGPDGSMYKCWEHIGDPRFAYDNLLFGADRSSSVLSWVAYDPTTDSQCRECSILPLCMGGCPEKARIRGDGARECNDLKYSLDVLLRAWAEDYLGRVTAG